MTDAHLASLAASRQASLATLDQKLAGALSATVQLIAWPARPTQVHARLTFFVSPTTRSGGRAHKEREAGVNLGRAGGPGDQLHRRAQCAGQFLVERRQACLAACGQ